VKVCHCIVNIPPNIHHLYFLSLSRPVALILRTPSQVVVGWPVFLIYYLRKIQQAGRLDNARVQDRVGFLFQQYRPEYLFFDVVETVRKLWLVTVVRFDLLNLGECDDVMSLVRLRFLLFRRLSTDPVAVNVHRQSFVLSLHAHTHTYVRSCAGGVLRGRQHAAADAQRVGVCVGGHVPRVRGAVSRQLPEHAARGVPHHHLAHPAGRHDGGADSGTCGVCLSVCFGHSV
jgi:hypothetical protein